VGPYFGSVAGYPIPIFAIALDLGALAGVFVAARLAAGRGLALHRVLDVALAVLLAALAGSRAWYVARHWSDYAANPLTVLAVWEGGLALTGAIAAGALALVVTARAFRLNLGYLADAAGVGAALGQAIGRLGCLPAGCAAGRPAAELPRWLPALVLPDATGTLALRFPSQLIESTADLLLALVLLRLWNARARRAPGRVGLTYLAGYCVIRLVAQPFRA
jgi:phosphatidylglycerol:prolipoprotein diacylglycerol transferase